MKNSKSVCALNTKFSTPSPSTLIKPMRSTVSTMKTTTTTTLPRSYLTKHSSACDLRERINFQTDDILNTGFASTPPLSRVAKLPPKNKSTTLSSCYTPSSIIRSGNGINSKNLSTSTAAQNKYITATNKSTPKQLFGGSTTSLNKIDSGTPDSCSKFFFDASVQRSVTKSSKETSRTTQKNDDFFGAGFDGKTKLCNSEFSNLMVAVRVRPMNAKECTTPSVMNVISVDDNEITVLAGTSADSSAGVSYSFYYDYAFCSYNTEHENFADQETVFRETTIPLIDKAFEGYNACLFAYGQTGSGKSYSMMGIDSDDDVIRPNSEAGIIPRFCHELFRRIDMLKGKFTAEIEVSYFEIYNEKIHDLFAVTPTSDSGGNYSMPSSQVKRTALRVREHPTWGPYVVDLNVHPVGSLAALKNWLAVGNSQRATAATGMNGKSSRSHSIFNIILNLSEEIGADVIKTNSRGSGNIDNRKALTKRSKISLVDLAGSERVSQTCASGERLKEGVSINKSLLTLSKVIAALADAKKNSGCFVPYRESVLTWLLRESLGGNSKTVMLATISPASVHLDETLATLRYACQARSIINRVKVNEDPNDRQIRELRAEVERLQALQQDYERQKIHAVQAPPRKIIIETIDGTEDQIEKDALRQQLRETEQELVRAQKSWRERLKEAENLRKNEIKLLQQNGLELKLSVAQKQPCLINLATDPMLSGMLLYMLPPGIVRIGRPKPSTHAQSDIVLDGPLVGLNHCQIENKSNKLFIRPDMDGCETFVNGELIKGEREIFHGDRVVIGGSHYFRISNPNCPHRQYSSVMDYQSAHQEVLKEQEKRLRMELLAEKQAAIKHIEDQRAKNELSYNEKVAILELEQFRFKCSQELIEAEKEVMARNQLNESTFEYKPFESHLSEKIRRIMEHPTEEGLHETQMKVKEATQRCRNLGLNYEFVQMQVVDEVGLFKAVVKIIDRENNRVAKWPTARLNVWLDLIRDNCDITAENLFYSVDVNWSELSDDTEVNESLNSSRISLNLSAMKDALLGNPIKSCFKQSHNKLSPWSERTEANTECNRKTKNVFTPANTSWSKPQRLPDGSYQNMKKKLSYDDCAPDNDLSPAIIEPKNDFANFSEAISTSTPSDETFEVQAQQQLRDLRKATLRMKNLCHKKSNENAATDMQCVASKVLSTLEGIESLTNEIRRLLKNVAKEPPLCKTPKSVRFLLD